MASPQRTCEELPPYSYQLPTGEQILAEGSKSSLGITIIRIVQETLPGTSINDAWRLIQNVADLMREFREIQRGEQPPADVPESVGAYPDDSHDKEGCPYPNPLEDVLMHNGTRF